MQHDPADLVAHVLRRTRGRTPTPAPGGAAGRGITAARDLGATGEHRPAAPHPDARGGTPDAAPR